MIEENARDEETPSKGIPDFWLEVMSSAWMLNEMIQKYDAPILKFLVDITYETHVNPNVGLLYILLN